MNWEELKEAKLPIVLYGMGDGADRILAALAAHGLQAAGVCCQRRICPRAGLPQLPRPAV